MKKIKVITVVGTRPEIIRLSRLIPMLDEATEHILVHTGQNFDHQLNQVFFDEMGIRPPDYHLGIDTASVGRSLAGVITGFETVLLKEQPRAVMILGDTNSSIAAIVAERHHIPVYHMEAGNRSFDRNVPEELNRKLIDHVSSFNLPYNDYAKTNLLAEGIHPRTVFVTGSPMKEVLDFHREHINSSSVLEKLSVEPGRFFVASIHRQENVDNEQRLSGILQALESISNSWGLPVLVSTHPRTRNRLRDTRRYSSAKLKFHHPFGFFDFNKLQQSSLCVLSDSGSISEESAILGFSAVSLRDSIERPESIDHGSMLLSSTVPETITQSVQIVLNKRNQPPSLPSGYSTHDFSNRVLNVLFSTFEQYPFWTGVRRP